MVKVTTASADRVDSRCPAAAAGAGCCDYAELNPTVELEIKSRVLRDQLERIGGIDELPEFELHDLEPTAGWRTRVRLGVDASGRAGFRKLKSNELVTEVACSQVVPELLEGLVGEGARRFTPGVEIIAAIDDAGQRHVVESRKAPRGRRTETVLKVLEGTGEVEQKVGDYTWKFPVSSFWQAHTKAPAAYSEFIAEALTGLELVDVDKRFADACAPTRLHGGQLAGFGGQFCAAGQAVMRDRIGGVDDAEKCRADGEAFQCFLRQRCSVERIIKHSGIPKNRRHRRAGLQRAIGFGLRAQLFRNAQNFQRLIYLQSLQVSEYCLACLGERRVTQMVKIQRFS